jgi:hypothetical protein
MATTSSKEYFMFLGQLQNYPEGLEIIEECEIWTLYYSLVELRGREDIVKCIITTANYDKYFILISVTIIFE